MREWIKQTFEKCMTQPDYNSRLVFFIHGIGSTVAMLILTIAFIAAKDKESYPYMVGAVGGAGLAGGVSRWMTKKGGADDKANSQNPAPKIDQNA